MRTSAGTGVPRAGLAILLPLVNTLPLTPDLPWVLAPLYEPFSRTGVIPACPRQAAAITLFIFVDGRAGM